MSTRLSQCCVLLTREPASFWRENVIAVVTLLRVLARNRGFIKVLNRRATEFDTRAKNWQGPPLGGIRGHAPPENFEIL